MDTKLIVTLIQSKLHWEDKQANLQMFEEKIYSIKERTAVVVLPEMFSTGFSMKPEKLAEKMDGPTLEWMKRIAASKNIILTGSIIILDNGSYYNRLIWMLPNGEMGIYDKRHLFAFGSEDKYYSHGNKRLIASVNGWRVHLLICYDLRFPVWSRNAIAAKPVIGTSPEGVSSSNKPEYDLLIYVANWPDRRRLAWMTLLQARAIENQCFVVGVNRVGYDGNNIYHTGDSMVTDPMGEVLYHKKDDEDIFSITLDKNNVEMIREKLPFWKETDEFVILSDQEG